MGTESRLSHLLINMGFVPVIGTTERGGDGSSCVVGTEDRKTWDKNNGVIAVYDERGIPWLISARELPMSMDLFSNKMRVAQVKRGAYVPHSNDGGRFIHETLPQLLS